MGNKFAKLITKKLTAGILLFVFLFTFFPNFSIAQTQNSFVIQLKEEKNLSGLFKVSSNLQKRFSFSSEQAFSNIYTFDSGLDLSHLKTLLAGSFNYLEPQKKISSAGVFVNDPGFSTNAENIDRQWALIKAGFNSAWEQTVGSNDNIVAVIDTGVDQTHEDLKSGSFILGHDFITNRDIPLGSNSDDSGHGTLVAGILAATTNNGKGIAGTNWKVTIMPLKALDQNGKGDAEDVAESIVWAVDHGAQFINLSVGGVGFGHDTTLANAVSYAFNRNALIVAASGNDISENGTNLDTNPIFPVCDDNNFNMIIGVAATDVNDFKADFSNFGKNCIDVTAPGKRILSTINIDPLNKKSSPNSYVYASGSSLAVPFVVGQAALIKSLYPLATNIQIRDRIISTTDPVDNLNFTQCSGGSCRGLLGTGRINVAKSLQTAISQPFSEGDIVKVTDSDGVVYQIFGGQKRLISPFVYNQKFPNSSFKTTTFGRLTGYPEGPYVTPTDGTLVKYNSSPVVYLIQSGQKFPVTYQVFKQRGFNFANVKTLSVPELDSWVIGNFLPPVEGTLLKTAKNKTVYWVVNQTLHPTSYKFFVDRGLNIFPILVVADSDINGFAKGEAYFK